MNRKVKRMTRGKFKKQAHVWVSQRKKRFGKWTSVGCTQSISFHLSGMRKRLRRYLTIWCRKQRHDWINHVKPHKRIELLMLTPGLDVLCGRWTGWGSLSPWAACHHGLQDTMGYKTLWAAWHHCPCSVSTCSISERVWSLKFPQGLGGWEELQWSLKTWFSIWCLEVTYCHEGFTYSNGKWEMPEVLVTVLHSSATPHEYSSI